MFDFDKLHQRLRRNFCAQRFAELCRVALSAGFFAPGMTKVLGLPFSNLGLDNPVGFFFEALFRTQPYWQFLGWFQVISAVLVLIPRFAYMGAFLFVILLLNVVIITISLPFAFTPVITTLMFLAALYLLFWDFPRFKPLLPQWRGEAVELPESPKLGRLERSSYLLMVFAGWLQTCCMRGVVEKFLPETHYLFFQLSFPLGLLGLLLLLSSWLGLLIKSKRQNASKSIS